MGYRCAFQETLDSLAKSGVHVWRWSRVGSHERARRENELGCGGSRAGFHVLARCETQIRLVSRAGLRLQLWARARAVRGHNGRAAYRDPVMPARAVSLFVAYY